MCKKNRVEGREKRMEEGEEKWVNGRECVRVRGAGLCGRGCGIRAASLSTGHCACCARTTILSETDF